MLPHSFNNATAITPNDSTPVINSSSPISGIYVGGGAPGDVVVITAGGQTTTFKAVPIGVTLFVRAVIVKSTGTTATNLVALW